jgi:hypothetical protein
MNFNQFIVEHRDGFPATTSHQKSTKLEFVNLIQKQYFEELHDLIGATEDDDIRTTPNLLHKNTNYMPGQFIVTQTNNVSLFKIIEIIMINLKYMLVTRQRIIEKFDHHLRSYIVGEGEGNFKLIRSEDINSLPLNLHKTVNGVNAFRIKSI